MGTSVNVAVLVTDLVGSTAQASRVGPEVAEELRVEHFALLRTVIAAHEGREVKNTGDGLMVVFPAASRALAAGAAMQQACDARNRRSVGERMDIRVGVATGEADEDEDEGDFWGTPVIEAVRLCAIADAGQVLTTQLTRQIVGARGGYEFVWLGERELKGLPSPVAVLEVMWEPLSLTQQADIDVPLPARLTAAVGHAFAGRADEQSRWTDVWKSVVAGERRAWMLEGEAGIGKTSLMAHLAARANDDGAVILYGRCDEDLGVPYQPWAEAMAALIAHAPEALIADHIAARGGVLARLVPELSTRAEVALPDASDPQAERYALFAAVNDLVVRAATLAPVLLVLEDLHWADRPTVQLLRHLVQTSAPARLMITVTYRPTDLGAGHPLAETFAPLRREPGVEFVILGGLGDVELLELMQAIAGHELDETGLVLRDAIASETDGNPFFVREILRHLAETGALVKREGQWVATRDLAAIGLPVSIRQVVGERVSRLGPDAERLLRTASVIGRDFELGLLAQVADVDEDRALDILDTAVSAALVTNVGPDRYSFAHALIAHTLYEELTPSRRGRVHRRIATALEQQQVGDGDERVGELAHHWAAALVPTDAAKAIAYAKQAGDRALAQLAPDEARRWFERALQLHAAHSDDAHAHAQLLVALGEAQRQAGDPAHRETLLGAAAEAQAIGDTDLLVTAALANTTGWASSTGTVDQDRVAVLDTALGAVGSTDSCQRSRLLATLAVELTFDADQSRRWDAANESVAIARRLHDPATLLAALIGVLSLPGRAGTDHLRYADEAISIARKLDDQASVAIAAASGVTSAVSFADRARLETYVPQCCDAAERVGQPTLVLRAIGVRALKAIIDGDLDAAEALANEVLPEATNRGYALLWYGSIIITIRAHQGRGPEVRQMIATIAADPAGGSAAELARTGLALADVQAGDYDVARAGFEAIARDGFPSRDDQLHLARLCINAHVCARLEADHHAAQLLELLRPHASLVAATPSVVLSTVPTAMGMLSALLGRDDDADGYFTEALALTSRLQAPYLVASAQLEWARALLRRAPISADRARGLITEALAAAERHKYGEIERDAVDLQSYAGAGQLQ